jgi:hypothetical protein
MKLDLTATLPFSQAKNLINYGGLTQTRATDPEKIPIYL